MPTRTYARMVEDPTRTAAACALLYAYLHHSSRVARDRQTKPKVDDLLIFSGTIFNRYGHVAIISKVTENEIEIIQQNAGPFRKSRELFTLDNQNDKWEIKNNRVLGWLRKK